MERAVKLIECPRDAMQGWKSLITTKDKVGYINSLLQVGFDTIDFGSFVSPRAIPQMADTAEVLESLKLENTTTRLLAIVANIRGAELASSFEKVSYLGYPFSISETFQQRNTNSSINESLERVKGIQELCAKYDKRLVIYISMAFGNPYNDPYSVELVYEWVDRLSALGITIISLADTVGLATAGEVGILTRNVIASSTNTEIGVHLHSSPGNWQEKFVAALEAGCLRFDGALKGIGGCPMANDELVGNMTTEWMIEYLRSNGYQLHIDTNNLNLSLQLANKIFH